MRVQRGKGVLPEPKVSPVQRARQLEAAKAIQTGKHVIPLACGYCHSPNIATEGSGWYYTCVACGRDTETRAGHTMRKQKIAAYIREGVDPAWLRKASSS